MKHFLFYLLSFVALWAFVLCSCKTQRSVAPFVLRDSISITYKQGKEQPFSLTNIEEQPTPMGVIGAATSQDLCNQQRIALDNYRSYEVATRCKGNPNSLPSGGGVKSVKSVGSVRDIRIRVDTVFVERWHTRDVLQAQPVLQSQRDGPSAGGGLSAKRSQFYKDCTWGFFVLLLLIIGRIALRITKAIYLR